MIRERKDCLELSLKTRLSVSISATWGGGGTGPTLLEELSYAIPLSGKRVEKKPLLSASAILIAAIVDCQVTEMLPCLSILTRRSEARDPWPRNQSKLIPLSQGYGLKTSNKVRHYSRRRPWRRPCEGFTAARLFMLNAQAHLVYQTQLQVSVTGDLGSAGAGICCSSVLHE